MTALIFAESEGNSSVRRLLDGLGAEFQVSPLEGILSGVRPRGAALVLSEPQFVASYEAARLRSNTLEELLSGFKQILIFPFMGTAEGLRALESVAKARISAAELPLSRDSEYVVHGARDMCGPFSGLRIAGVKNKGIVALTVHDSIVPVEFVVTANAGSLLTRFKLDGVDLFVASSETVFDTSSEYRSNLDVRECFSGLVPVLFFLRHCRIETPYSPVRWANWIIDDPNLRPTYGFLDLKELSQCVREIGVATSIAFIPWNHKRTDAEIVGLVRNSQPQLSVCIHGCDHTEGEFSTRSMSHTLPLIDLAIKRMKDLETETSLGFEKVMVFPQGRFSGEAMRALRRSELLAAVNTELIDCQTGSGVKGHELLRPAITSFGGFPLFMRRPPEDPLANFALDLMLGKPCLVVSHHQYFQHGLKSFEAAAAALKGLDPEMVWVNLERGISCTYTVTRNSGSTANVRLFSSRTTVQTQPGERICFTKAETDPEDVQILVNERPHGCSRKSQKLQFTVEATGSDRITVDARVVPVMRPQAVQSPKYRLMVSTRRYLTELRDNYLCKFPRLNAQAASMRNVLSRKGK